MKNLWFILRTVPFADKKAHDHLQTVVNMAREYNMPGYLAKALYGLGVLARKKKKYGAARSYFTEALKVAETSDLYIAEKIRTALNSLDESGLKRK
jgi:uncharacterized protein HemY